MIDTVDATKGRCDGRSRYCVGFFTLSLETNMLCQTIANARTVRTN